MNELIEMYSKFRQELDKMCIPLILANVWINRIYYEGKWVGMLCTTETYIDCIYIEPKYRNKGLAKKAVLEWYDKQKNNPFALRLHIINDNTVALKFWNSIFELKVVDRNQVDTLYEIKGVKKNDRCRG